MNIARILQALPALLLLLVGLLMAWIGSSYRVGSLTAMGPGFMPMVLGLALALLSLVLLLTAARDIGEETLPPLPLRPLVCVVASLLLWVLLVERIGFVPAGILQLLLSSLALPQQGWRGTLLGSVVLTLCAWLLFVVLLGLPLAAFGSR